MQLLPGVGRRHAGQRKREQEQRREGTQAGQLGRLKSQGREQQPGSPGCAVEAAGSHVEFWSRARFRWKPNVAALGRRTLLAVNATCWILFGSLVRHWVARFST